MRGEIVDVCFRPAEERMQHAQAIELLRARISPIAPVEPLPLQAALGRILACSVTAPHPVRAHTIAAVDGYAFAHAAYDRA